MRPDDDSPKRGRKQLVSKSDMEGGGTIKLKAASTKERTKDRIVWGISIAIGLMFLFLAVGTFPSQVKDEYKDTYDTMDETQQRLSMKEGFLDINTTFNTTGYWVKDETKIGWHSFLMLTFLGGVGPIAIYESRKRKKIDRIEERLSDFLRDISESMRAGQTLHEAIKTSAGGEYGALTPEIQKMALQVSWGISVTKTLEMFALRVNTPLVQRSVTLINEASSAGGNVSNVIDAAAKDTREIQIMKMTRATEMGIYKLVIGVSFLVFLVVVAVMFFSFMPEMENLSDSYSSSSDGSVAQSPGGFDPTGVDFEEVRLLFFAAVAVQAVGDGIVAGIMATGRIKDGLVLATYFGAFTLIAFDLFLL